MSKSYRSQIEKLRGILNQYHSFAESNRQRLEKEPWLAKQFLFWIESTRFLITELEIWEELDNHGKCDQTIHKIQKALKQLWDLAEKLP